MERLYVLDSKCRTMAKCFVPPSYWLWRLNGREAATGRCSPDHEEWESPAAPDVTQTHQHAFLILSKKGFCGLFVCGQIKCGYTHGAATALPVHTANMIKVTSSLTLEAWPGQRQMANLSRPKKSTTQALRPHTYTHEADTFPPLTVGKGRAVRWKPELITVTSLNY